MKVLVGYDGSDGARDAVELVRVLSDPAEDEALLVNVIPFGGPLPVAYSLLGYTDRAEVREFFDPARARLGEMSVETRSYAGDSPSRLLSELSESADIDLLVVGSPRRGALGRTFLGSISEKLLYGVSVPIAVAPRGYAGSVPHGLRRIAVAYDGGAEAKLALAHGIALAEAMGAQLQVLTVDSPPVPMPGPLLFTLPSAFDTGEVIEEALLAIGSAVHAEARRLSGPPAGALADACASDVDLLVAGSRGYGPLGRVFIGSVTAGLICKSPCPVIVVPRAKETRDQLESRTSTVARKEASSGVPD